MATYNKFNQYVLDLVNGVHDWDAHTYKLMLTNTAPVATNSVKADLTEIAAGNGYTAGGAATTITTSVSSGTSKAVGTDVTWTASGGTVGPFRYVVLYNDTPTSPADPLVAWWDYGSALTLGIGDSFTADVNATNGFWSLT